MLGILLPFSMMTLLIDYQREIRIGAGIIVIAMGLYLSLIHISEPTRQLMSSRMPSSA